MRLHAIEYDGRVKFEKLFVRRTDPGVIECLTCCRSFFRFHRQEKLDQISYCDFVSAVRTSREGTYLRYRTNHKYPKKDEETLSKSTFPSAPPAQRTKERNVHYNK